MCDISGDPQVSQMTWLRLFYKCTASWFVCCLPWFWHSTDFCRSLGGSIICLEFVKDLENFRTRTCKCWLRFIFGLGVLICPTLQMQVLWCRQLVILGDVFVKNVWLWTSESKKTTNPAKGVKEKTPNILFHSLHAGGPLWSISRFWILKHLDRSWALCNHYNYDGCHFTGLQCGPAYHHYSDCIIASWLSGLMLGRMRCVGWVGQHDFANMSSFNQTLGSMLEARASQLVFNDWPIGLPFDAMLQKLCCQNSNRSPAHQLVWVFLGCDVRLI